MFQWLFFCFTFTLKKSPCNDVKVSVRNSTYIYVGMKAVKALWKGFKFKQKRFSFQPTELSIGNFRAVRRYANLGYVKDLISLTNPDKHQQSPYADANA